MVCDVCYKIVLVTFNIIWVLVGAVFIGLGVAFHYAIHTILLKFLNTLPLSALPVDTSNIINWIGQADEFKSYATQLSIPFIVVGAVFFGIGFFGCCGAWCSNRICLLVYIIIVCIIISAQILVAIVIGAKKDFIREKVQGEIKGIVTKTFDGANGTAVSSQLFNIGMLLGECCGLTNYSDFYAATKWNRTFVKGEGAFSVNPNLGTFIQKIPAACCKRIKPVWPKSSAVSDFILSNITDMSCIKTPTTVNSHMSTPCWSKVEKWILDNQTWVIIIFVFCLIIQAVLVGFACAMYKNQE